MITKARTFFADDVCQENQAISLDDASLNQQIGAWTGLLTRLPEEGWHDVGVRATEVLKSVFDELGSKKKLKVWLFVANATEQPDTRLIRYKGFKSSLDLGVVMSEEPLHLSEIFAAESGIRFAALIDTEKIGLADLVEAVRKQNGFFWLSDEQPTPRTLKNIFGSSFGEQPPYSSSVNWKDVLKSLEFKKSLICRITGEFDDSDLGIDVFGDVNELSLLRC